MAGWVNGAGAGALFYNAYEAFSEHIAHALAAH